MTFIPIISARCNSGKVQLFLHKMNFIIFQNFEIFEKWRLDRDKVKEKAKEELENLRTEEKINQNQYQGKSLQLQ